MYKDPIIMKNIAAEMKNTLDKMNSRLGDTKVCISGLEDRVMKIN